MSRLAMITMQMKTMTVPGLLVASMLAACGGSERSAADYCSDFASKRCDRLQECLGPAGLAQNGLPLTKEECVARVRLDLNCEGLMNDEACPSGGMFDAAQANACISQLGAAECSAFGDLTFGVEACNHLCTGEGDGPGGDDDDDTAPDASVQGLGAFYLGWEFQNVYDEHLSCSDIGATAIAVSVWPPSGERTTDTFDCDSHQGTTRLLPYAQYGIEVTILSGQQSIGGNAASEELYEPLVDLGTFVWTAQ